MMPPAKADALAGEEGVVWPWLKQMAEKMQSKGWLDSSGVSDLVQCLPMADTDAVGLHIASAVAQLDRLVSLGGLLAHSNLGKLLDQTCLGLAECTHGAA